MLPEQGIAAKGVLIEMRSQVAVQQQQDGSSGQAWESEQQQEGRHQRHPREQRHAVDAHPWCAQLENRHYKIERARNRRDAQHQHAQNPEIGIHARSTLGSVQTAVRLTQWRIHKPAAVGRLPDQEAGLDENTAKEQHPVAESIHAREGHIASADHQRHHIITEAGQRGHHEQENHRRAMHREKFIIGLWAHHLSIGLRQLCADQESLHTAHQEEKEAGEHVHNTDHFMVGRGQPLTNIAFAKASPANECSSCTFTDSAGCHEQFLQDLDLYTTG